MLHITNGDAAGDKLAASGLGGEVLPWRDVLHEGPVPEGVSPDEMRAVRARFLADQGWAGYEQALAGLTARDGRLERLGPRDEVVLWFEHDLYDQLQLLQALEQLHEHAGSGRVALVCIDGHPAVERFLGLGQLRPEHFVELFPSRTPVTGEQLALAREAWTAFRSPDASRIEALVRAGTAPLPLLGPALRRHLEQFPSTHDGLSRTAYQIVKAAASGVRTPAGLFRATRDMEAAPFLGDTSFWVYLADLCSGPRPALRFEDGRAAGDVGDRAAWERAVQLTAEGDALCRGRADWVDLRGGIDRWLGGVHLRGTRPRWRWDRVEGRLTGGLSGAATPVEERM